MGAVISLMIVLHVVAGSVAVCAMLGALCARKGAIWHRRFGRIYVHAMAVALLLALVVSVLTANLFLLLIGLFSSYLIYTGWRLAIVKTGAQSHVDRLIIRLMLIVGVLMIGYGGYMSVSGDSLGIALLVLGVAGFAPAWSDLQRQGAWPKGKARILEHLSRMGGGCIATVTAVVVTNVQTSPAFIAWLLPGIIGGVLLTYWSRRLSSDSAI